MCEEDEYHQLKWFGYGHGVAGDEEKKEKFGSKVIK